MSKSTLTPAEAFEAYQAGKHWAEDGNPLPAQEKQASAGVGSRAEYARKYIEGYMAGCPKWIDLYRTEKTQK